MRWCLSPNRGRLHLCSLENASQTRRRLDWSAWWTAAALALTAPGVRADINDWRTGQVIPGTEGIIPGPSVQLASYDGEWNTPDQNLQFADFRGGLFLYEADFSYSWLDEAKFPNADLTRGLFLGSSLTKTDFTSANLTDALLLSADLTDATFNSAALSGTGFSDTIVQGTKLWDVTSRGFTFSQLASTRGYQSRNLERIELPYNELSGWNFSEENLTDANLSYANLTGANLSYGILADTNLSASDLTRANLNYATLDGTDFSGAIVQGAKLWDVTSRGFTEAQLASTASYQAKNLQAIELAYNDLSGWYLSEQNLTNANLSYATLIGTNFNYATLAGANFSEAIVKGAKLWDVTSRGFTRGQLESTASYQAKDLEAIELAYDDLRGWDFREQNLTSAVFTSSDLTEANLNFARLVNATFTNATLVGADLNYANLTGANLSGAILNRTKLWGVTARGFTQAQLEASGSYQNKDLQGIELPFNNLDGWSFHEQNLTNALLGVSKLAGADFSGANLTNASLHGTTLANANFAGAILRDASLEDTTSRGFTRGQLESTASFAAKDLRGIRLWNNNMTGWNFAGQNLSNAEMGNSSLANASFAAANLTNASLNSARLANADFTGAVVQGADLRGVTPLGFTPAQFASTASYQSKDLRGVGLTFNDLTGWDLSEQNLAGANLGYATLAGADLSGAHVRGASFESTTSRGFTREQLESTASYQAHDLRGVSLLKNDLSGWDLRGQNLADALLGSARLVQTDFTGADLRGVLGLDLTGAIVGNTILPSGVVRGLGLPPGAELVLRDDDGLSAPPPGRLPRDPISLTVEDHFTMAAGSTLQLILDADPWDSLIGFEPGIAVRLAGTLDLRFDSDVDVVAQNGRTIRLFNWNGVAPRGAFTIGGPYGWDVSELYSTGEVTLTLSGTHNNGKYDIHDLNNVRNNFGGAGLGDYDDDGDVDIHDLNIVRNNFGGTSSSPPVPEPQSFLLLTIALAALVPLKTEH